MAYIALTLQQIGNLFNFSFSTYIQTWVIRDYPEELVVTSICCSMVVILSAIVALIVEGNSKVWILRPDRELVAVCYSVSTNFTVLRKLRTY